MDGTAGTPDAVRAPGERADEERADEERAPRVSVIVPVYNSMPYLVELLGSLVGQDLDRDAFDVIAVDDGSTDESAATLDAYAAEHPNVTVIHQENSGWPGRPRNVGIAASAAEYVFFADGDDVLAPEALRRMLDFADEHGSDVVIPSLAGLGGRKFLASIYDKTVVDADLVTVFNTLYPQKLYRRELLVRESIAFPEGKIRLEDGIFNASVYVHAGRISILSDYDYYFLRSRDDGGNISSQRLQPVGYTASIAEISRIATENLGDTAQSRQIVSDLYRRKCLKFYRPGRYKGYAESEQEAWLAEHKAYAARFVTDEMERALASPFRERSHLVRHGDREQLLALGEVEASPKVTARLVEATATDGALTITVEARVDGRFLASSAIVCELRRRDGEGLSAVSLFRIGIEPAYGRAARFTGTAPAQLLEAMATGVWDLFVTLVGGEKGYSGRVSVEEEVALPPAVRGGAVYRTQYGNASLRKRSAGAAAPAEPGKGRRPRSLLSRVARRLGLRR